MTNWTSGYVADVGYTFGYYHELNPLRAQLAFTQAGLECPTFGTACELGFGQGMSTNLHAAASNISWWGTDFNPSQAAFAQSIAKNSSSGAQLFDESFAEFCTRDDLPEFDYIGLHGIWSWISDENRKIIVDFVRRKLKVGGILYISYNTLPGWAAFAPMRHLMTKHAEVLGAEGRGIISRIDGAIEFADKLLATKPIFGRVTPSVSDRLNIMKKHNRHYLAHEYFNRDWHPMHFADMADWLEPAKVQFACSANLLDAVDALNLTTEQKEFLAEIPDPMFRETTRDFMVNQQFRKDYWVKGIQKISPIQKSEILSKLSVVLVSARDNVELKVNGSLGEAKLKDSIYQGIIGSLSDNKVKTLAEIKENNKELNSASIVEAVMVLIGAGYLNIAQQENSKIQKNVKNINTHLMNKARGSNEVGYLASAVTGGGVPVQRFHQLFLQAFLQGKKKPEEWGKHAWSILASQGQRILKDGKAIESDEENLQEIINQAEEFGVKKLPILRALEVI